MSTEVMDSWEQPTTYGIIPAPNSEIAETSAADRAGVALSALFIADDTAKLFRPAEFTLRKDTQWDVKDGVGVYEAGLGIWDNTAFKIAVEMRERTNVFITMDPTVLDESTGVAQLKAEAENKFLHREVGRVVIGLSASAPEMAVGMTAATVLSGGNLWVQVAGVLLGGSAGIYAASATLDKVLKKIKAPIKAAEDALSTTVEQSSLTCAIPNYGHFTKYMGSDIVKLLQLSKDRREELAVLLPLAEQVVRAEIQTQEIAPRLRELKERVKDLQDKAEISLSTDTEELAKLQAQNDQATKIAKTYREQITQRLELREKEISFVAEQKTYRKKMEDMVRVHTKISPTLMSVLTTVKGSFDQAYVLDSFEAMNSLVSDFGSAMEAIRTENDSTLKLQLVQQAYDALVVKYKDKVTLPHFEDIYR